MVGMMWIVIVAVLAIFIAVNYQHITSTTEDPGPLPLIIFNYVLASNLRRLADFLTKPSHKALVDAMGAWRSEVQYACVRARIAETLADHGPLTIQELSKFANTSYHENVQRLLRAAESFGYFREDSKGRWHNTRLSEVLIPTHPVSVNALLRHFKEDSEASWSHLYESIFEDRHVFQEITNQKCWEYFQTHPEQEKQFQEAMGNQDALSTYVIAHDYPHWSTFRRVVDYGGGHGRQLMKILNRFPNTLKGILFDQPQVIDMARSLWKSELPSEDRVSMVGGSFFELESLPVFQDHDAILLRTILHDWSDEECIQIMQTLRKRIGSAKHVKVLISDMVIREKDPVAFKYLLDLHMKLFFHHAKERYLFQWQNIFQKSGFRIVQMYTIRTISNIIELEPV